MTILAGFFSMSPAQSKPCQSMVEFVLVKAYDLEILTMMIAVTGNTTFTLHFRRSMIPFMQVYTDLKLSMA